MRFVIYALLFICSSPLLAQTGNYFLSHYVPKDERFDNVCFGMAQDNHGVLYFATKAGVLQFDGRNWEQLNSNGAVYALTSNATGEIFWGGANGFGRINYGENGFIQNQVLSSTVQKDIFQCIVNGDNVYFLSDQVISVYSISTSKTTEIKSSNLTGSFSSLFELYGNVYVNSEKAGTFRIDKNILTKAKIDTFENSEIIFSTQYENAYLIGTRDNRIYLCAQNLRLHQVVLEDQTYVNAGVVIGGNWINKQLIVLGTLRGGVIFINPQTGKTKEIVNYNTGLPDNEVFAMITDRNQNIWIAHDYGFTRVAPYLPLRSFSHYDGLNGNLLCSISLNQQVYVGTSLGLFKLEKEEVYDEIIYYENVKVEEKKKEKNKSKQETVKKEEVKEPVTTEVAEVEAESKKKGFFSFLRRKKTAAVVEEKPAEPVKTEPEKSNESEEKTSFFRRKPTFKREQKIQKILRSSQFVYKKVQGIDAKVTQLLEVQGKLIAAGLGGAYEVSALQAKPLLEEPVRFIFANKDILLAATYNDEVRSWSFQKKWTQTNLFDNLDDEITFIFEGAENELWFCALSKIYRVEVSPNEVKNVQALEISNGNLNESVGIHFKGNTIITNAEGFYSYSASKRELVKIDTLPKPSVYFADSKSLWYRDSHGWNSFGSLGETNLQLLSLFQDLRFITTDQNKGNLWLITGNNELFKFFGEKLRPYEAGYPLLLKSIKNGKQTITSQDKIKINEQSPFSIEVIQPDYISAQSMEYRFFVKGLHKTWSDWNNNNVVDFPYLPPGKYTLEIQAKDIFGKVSEMNPIQFMVQPPYWQRPWFYALEFGVFALLVVLSFRLSGRYVIISRILSLLTIILLIQFIQTVASITFTQASPVLDFFIQVIVALLILPVEGYLRKLMLRSIDAHEGYRIIPAKKEISKKAKEDIID